MILSYKSFGFHEKYYNARSWPSKTPHSASSFMRTGSCFANINHQHNTCAALTISTELWSEPVYLSIITLHYTQNWRISSTWLLLGTVTAITHPIAVHSAPSLSEDIVVIVVQNPLDTSTAHRPAEAAMGSQDDC